MTYTAQRVTCRICGYKWVAVCHTVRTDDLECPECHNMTGDPDEC